MMLKAEVKKEQNGYVQRWWGDCPQKHLKEVERVVHSKDKEIRGLLFLLKLL